MGNVVDLEELKKKRIMEVEDKARKMYKMYKLEEDSYLIDANFANTDEIDYAFKESAFYKDSKLRNDINRIIVNDGDKLGIICVDILADDKKILEVFNYGDEESYQLSLYSSLVFDEREMLINMIADAHKDKKINVVFSVNYNFEMLRRLVED